MKPNHLGFDMKVSKKSIFSQKTEGACSSTLVLPLRAAARRDARELGGYICSQVVGVVGSYEGAVARNDWRGTNYTQIA